jgi:hypothetical protein
MLADLLPWAAGDRAILFVFLAAALVAVIATSLRGMDQ